MTKKPTRLFDATTNVLTEYAVKPFPMAHTGPGGASALMNDFDAANQNSGGALSYEELEAYVKQSSR